MARIILAAMLLAALQGPVLARQGGYYAAPTYEPDPPEGYQPRLSAEAGVLCVKQCPNDMLPCDPASYKVADGRCTTQWR